MGSDCRHHWVLDSYHQDAAATYTPPTPGRCSLCSVEQEFTGGMPPASSIMRIHQSNTNRAINEQTAVMHSIISSGLYQGSAPEMRW
jgi:hypothetical protein